MGTLKEAKDEAKVLKGLIWTINRIEQCGHKLNPEEQMAVAKARIRFSVLTSFMFRNGETIE